ncbi:MAG: hypothetical protein IKP10_01125 [Clostridia bacterium]|nr:hypothetical protein [Clostridia bacterium]
MYSQEEHTALLGQLSRRKLAVWIPAVILAVILLAALVLRVREARGMSIHDDAGLARLRMYEIICYVSGALCAVWLIFADGLFLYPLRRYERHLRDMLEGIRHETEGAWGGVAGDVSEIGGVRFRAVSLIQKDEKGRPFDRRFYLDCEKEVPRIEDGRQVRITYHDRQIIAVECV